MCFLQELDNNYINSERGIMDMWIEIDYNPSPCDSFFISVSINNKEAISFDYTTKGNRVIKQVLIKKMKT